MNISVLSVLKFSLPLLALDRVYLFYFVAYSEQDQTLQNWFISKVSNDNITIWLCWYWFPELVYKCFLFFVIYLFFINPSFWCALYDKSYSLEFDNSERPECNNLLSIYQLVSGKTKEVRYTICIYIFIYFCIDNYNFFCYQYVLSGSEST